MYQKAKGCNNARHSQTCRVWLGTVMRLIMRGQIRGNNPMERIELQRECEGVQIPAGIKTTLEAQGCGMGASIALDARHKIMTLPGVSEADVDLVWDPPWTPQMISPEGRERLGID